VRETKKSEKNLEKGKRRRNFVGRKQKRFLGRVDLAGAADDFQCPSLPNNPPLHTCPGTATNKDEMIMFDGHSVHVVHGEESRGRFCFVPTADMTTTANVPVRCICVWGGGKRLKISKLQYRKAHAASQRAPFCVYTPTLQFKQIIFKTTHY